jgi:hypothetical protein
MKLISWRGCGKTDQALIFGNKIVEFGIADAKLTVPQFLPQVFIIVKAKLQSSPL